MRIKEVRKAKGKTLEELAVKAQMMKTALCSFENGRASTSINYVLFLRNEFGTSFDWIYDGERILKVHKPKSSKLELLDPIAIGLRIKEIRKQLGLNRVEFGKLTGISNPAVSLYENGKRTPRIETAKRIKHVIGNTLDWIYFGDEAIVPKSVERAKKNS